MLNAINNSSVAASFDNTVASARRAPPAPQLPSAQERQLVNELQQIDSEVRQHEQAHLAAAGGIAVSAPSFQYQLGPDGRIYAVSGEVQIDVSPANTPEETIAKAEKIRAAALAPRNPSSQDRAVAAAAMQMQVQAQAELLQRQQESEADSTREPPATAAQVRRALEEYRRSAAESPHPKVQTNA
jgi:hypothetical protein